MGGVLIILPKGRYGTVSLNSEADKNSRLSTLGLMDGMGRGRGMFQTSPPLRPSLTREYILILPLLFVSNHMLIPPVNQKHQLPGRQGSQ